MRCGPTERRANEMTKRRSKMPAEQVKILTPSGMLGYAFPSEWFKKGVEMGPDVITVDSGSTDSGPQKLGLGVMTCSREAYLRDISLLLEASFEHKIPVYISSAGGDGANNHVDAFVEIIREISAHRGYRFNVAAIYADIDKGLITDRLRSGKVAPLGPVPPLTEADIESATTIVAQMGAEPFLKALAERDDLDIIVSGRAYDPAPIAATGLRQGFDPGLCWHLGKIMECGALCAEPNGANILGILTGDYFEVEPLNPAERCTLASVAAHTLYEKSHPFLLPGPGGTLDVSDSVFTQVSDRRVRVSGSVFRPAWPYTVKLEGARKIGFRSIAIAGIRDPIFMSVLDDVLAQVTAEVRSIFRENSTGPYQIIFHQYGKNGVMGANEPVKTTASHELCVIIEVAAPTQQAATAVCNMVRTKLMHAPYPGKLATAGNLASPFTPLEIPLGEVCEFNVYHLMQVENGADLFPIRYLEI
jgi:hypothetical protein